MRVYIPKGSDSLNIKRVIFEYNNGEQVEVSREDNLVIRESFRPVIYLTTSEGDPEAYQVELNISFLSKDK
jgi:hypothetical protein